MRVHPAAIRLLCSLLLGVSTQGAWSQARPAVGPGQAVVHTALGGFILGYDIDPAGTEGLLSEALTRADGRHDIAIETFDQATGEIIRVLRKQIDSRNGYLTLGLFAGHVGLSEFEHVSDLYVDERRYLLADPVDGNRITGKWTPAFRKAKDILTGAARAQGFDTALFFGFRNTADDFRSYLFTSDVGANTFGPLIPVVGDDVFDWNNSPAITYDPGRGRAVLASSHGCFGCTIDIGQVDLATGVLSVFRGLGLGSVNGIAIDPNTHIACTTSEDDFSVEFYDFVRGTQRQVVLPGATSQFYSGGAVAVDPVHRLFLVGQEFSSTAGSGSSIHVFDEKGELVESLNGFRLPASPAYMALNPSQRSGYVIVTPDLTSLQSFTY